MYHHGQLFLGGFGGPPAQVLMYGQRFTDPGPALRSVFLLDCNSLKGPIYGLEWALGMGMGGTGN